MKKLIITLVLCWLFLEACSAGSAPRLIAQHPTTEEIRLNPPPTYWQPQLEGIFVYHAELALHVYRPAAATDRAERLVAQYGGYLASSRHWEGQDGETYTLELAVPPEYFEDLRAELLTLGDLQRETIWEDWQPYQASRQRVYSRITLILEPAITLRVDFPRSGWNPARTLQKATQVFFAIFGFLVDVLIWVVVVAGPFVLLGWGLYALVRRRQK